MIMPLKILQKSQYSNPSELTISIPWIEDVLFILFNCQILLRNCGKELCFMLDGTIIQWLLFVCSLSWLFLLNKSILNMTIMRQHSFFLCIINPYAAFLFFFQFFFFTFSMLCHKEEALQGVLTNVISDVSHLHIYRFKWEYYIIR